MLNFMKKFLTIILIILPVLAFSQNETGKLNNDVYNVVYTPIIPSKLTVKDGLAYFNYKTDTVVVPDSVNTRFIFLGKIIYLSGVAPGSFVSQGCYDTSGNQNKHTG